MRILLFEFKMLLICLLFLRDDAFSSFDNETLYPRALRFERDLESFQEAGVDRLKIISASKNFFLNLFVVEEDEVAVGRGALDEFLHLDSFGVLAINPLRRLVEREVGLAREVRHLSHGHLLLKLAHD